MALRGGKVDFLVLGGGVGGLSAVFYLQRLLAAAETGNSKDTQENPTSKKKVYMIMYVVFNIKFGVKYDYE